MQIKIAQSFLKVTYPLDDAIMRLYKIKFKKAKEFLMGRNTLFANQL